MVDKNGMPVTIENGDYLSDPRRDTTIADVGEVYDRVEELSFPMKFSKLGMRANVIQETYIKHGRTAAVPSSCLWEARHLFSKTTIDSHLRMTKPMSH